MRQARGIRRTASQWWITNRQIQGKGRIVMAKKASDLSSSEKRQVLEAIRQQIGDSQFEELRSKHGENGLMDMLLQAAEGKPQSQKNEGVDGTRWGCFGVLWVILTITVGSYTSRDVGLIFFFSPIICFLVYFWFRAQASSSSIDLSQPWGCAFVIMFGISGLFLYGISRMPGERSNEMLGVALIGGIAAWIVFHVAGAIVKSRRSKKGKR